MYVADLELVALPLTQLQAFMHELSRHIGPDTDVPAGQ